VATFNVACETVYGSNSVAEVGSRFRAANLRHAFIVTDPGVRAAGLADKVEGTLKEAGLVCTVFDGVSPNPRVSEVTAGVERMRAAGADGVVAVGGGSAMDAAKGMATVMGNGGHLRDYLLGLGGTPPTKPLAPLYAIPTTCGTGSEVSAGAVISDTESKTKLVLFPCAARLAVLDPAMVQTLPPHMTAASGMDALTHSVEAYVCSRADVMTRTFGVQAIRLIARALPDAVKEGDKNGALTTMLYAASLAGHAMMGGLGQVHALAHAAGGCLDVPHGATNAILLPVVMEHHLEFLAPLLAEIAPLMGENVFGLSAMQAAERAVAAMVRLRDEIGLPARLRDLGVKESDIEACADGAMGPAQFFFIVEPRPVMRDDVVGMYRRAL